MIQQNQTVPAPPQPAPAEPTIPSLGAGIDFTDPNSPLASYYCRTGHLVVTGLLGLLMVLFSYVPLWHTDVWGHLKFGRWMVQHGRLAENSLSPFGEPTAPGLHAYWLCQCGMYEVYHLGEVLAGGDATRQMEGGVQMLRALHILVLSVRLVVLLLALWRLTKSLPLATLGLVVVLAFGFGHVLVFRPQTFAELFFALVLLALSRPVLSVRALLFLPVLLAVWANTHGSYTLGLVLLGVWLVGQVVAVAWAQGSLRLQTLWADQQTRRLLLAGVLSLAAVSMLNPHGPYIFWNTFLMSQNPNVATMDEWQPITFPKIGAALWIYLSSVTLLVFTQALSKKWFTPGQIGLLLLFGIQPIFHQRMFIWWSTLAPWLAAPLWPSIAERLPRLWPFPESFASLRKTMLVGLLGLVLFLWSAPVQWIIGGAPAQRDKSLSQGTPWQLAEQLQNPSVENYPALTETLAAYGSAKRFHGRIFASETLGDYLLWALPDDMPVIVYTHVHLFSPEYWLFCRRIKAGGEGWNTALANWGVNLIVVEVETHPNLREKVLQDAAWKVVLDEKENKSKLDPRMRLFIAVRKKPI